MYKVCPFCEIDGTVPHASLMPAPTATATMGETHQVTFIRLFTSRLKGEAVSRVVERGSAMAADLSRSRSLPPALMTVSVLWKKWQCSPFDHGFHHRLRSLLCM